MEGTESVKGHPMVIPAAIFSRTPKLLIFLGGPIKTEHSHNDLRKSSWARTGYYLVSALPSRVQNITFFFPPRRKNKQTKLFILRRNLLILIYIIFVIL